MQHNIAEKFWYLASIAGLALVYLLGLSTDIMDIDAAQYASIAREMADSGNYLQVMHRGKDYLDKPPLLFWLSSLSFQLFGISNWAYKLPSFLSTLLGIFSLYRFCKLYYNKDTSRLAALIFASCQAMILINNDVRTDTLLTNFVIFTIWQMAAFSKDSKAIHFIGASIGLGLALMAKGPIGFMIPALAFGTHYILRGEWKQIFRPAWLGIILLSLILLSPMLWGLYEQHGSYGPYFFFWEQSFGRLTGENAFIQSQAEKQDPSYFFFTHTFLWSFLPFSLWAVLGIFRKILNIIAFKQRGSGNRELISLAAFVLPFIALSLSKYKLPHYIYVLYPFAAILTARFLMLMLEKKRPYWQRTLRYFQFFVCLAMIGIAGFIATQWFGNAPWYIFTLLALFAALSLLAFFSKQIRISVVFPSVMAIIGANIVINGFFYPELLKYQGTKEIAEYLHKNNIDTQDFYTYKCNFHSLDFYVEDIVKGVYSVHKIKESSDIEYLLVPEDQLMEIQKENIAFQQIETFQYYSVTILKPSFLNPETRSEQLKKLVLIQL